MFLATSMLCPLSQVKSKIPLFAWVKLFHGPAFLHSDPRLPRAVNGDHASLVHQFLLVKSLNVVSSLLSNG